MLDFKLDKRLQNDCIELAQWGAAKLLLMNNAYVPWFILVPMSDHTELMDLPLEQQQEVLLALRDLGAFVRENFQVDKLNIASIGNIVQQLHIHVVGRFEGDFCWPNVVWGCSEKRAYDQLESERIRQLVRQQLLNG